MQWRDRNIVKQDCSETVRFDQYAGHHAMFLERSDSMLSHHELAALLLIRDAQTPIHTHDSDFLALQHYRLVEMPENDGDASPRLTTRGHELLRRLGRDDDAESDWATM
jgi:hypothetical protein